MTALINQVQFSEHEFSDDGSDQEIFHVDEVDSIPYIPVKWAEASANRNN
ncbi:hypothetical protein EYZ11_012129 [Aspergillus tanneri]|uniref:Uncharacterized protein n=1 Tax=Aspergillus tanneri TaxID=1220188 RepID=A0A4S3J358_9EURO|nr:hypothetical protein EYZ11_012129 [Aspergillus tanneri]